MAHINNGCIAWSHVSLGRGELESETLRKSRDETEKEIGTCRSILLKVTLIFTLFQPWTSSVLAPDRLGATVEGAVGRKGFIFLFSSWETVARPLGEEQGFPLRCSCGVSLGAAHWTSAWEPEAGMEGEWRWAGGGVREGSGSPLAYGAGWKSGLNVKKGAYLATLLAPKKGTEATRIPLSNTQKTRHECQGR